jgi:hypothetical protein
VTATALTLKAGTYYRTRDGRKAYVSCIVEPSPFGDCKNENPCFGFINGQHPRHLWKQDGESACHHPASDLVDEWREPRTWTETITVFDGGSGQPCQTLGKVTGSIKVLARKAVTITEGEGV